MPYTERSYLPAAPLHDLILARRPVCRCYGVDNPAARPCLRCLARMIAPRLHVSAESARRRLARALRAPRVTWVTADELAIALGSHAVLLWPFDWTRAA